MPKSGPDSGPPTNQTNITFPPAPPIGGGGAGATCPFQPGLYRWPSGQLVYIAGPGQPLPAFDAYVNMTPAQYAAVPQIPQGFPPTVTLPGGGPPRFPPGSWGVSGPLPRGCGAYASYPVPVSMGGPAGGGIWGSGLGGTGAPGGSGGFTSFSAVEPVQPIKPGSSIVTIAGNPVLDGPPRGVGPIGNSNILGGSGSSVVTPGGITQGNSGSNILGGSGGTLPPPSSGGGSSVINPANPGIGPTVGPPKPPGPTIGGTLGAAGNYTGKILKGACKALPYANIAMLLAQYANFADKASLRQFLSDLGFPFGSPFNITGNPTTGPTVQMMMYLLSLKPIDELTIDALVLGLAGRPGGAINCNKYRDPNVRNLCKTVQKAYDDAFICPNLPADGGLAAQPTGTPFDNIACMQKRDEIVERLKELNERYQKDKKQRDDLANKALKYANQFCNWNCPDGTIQDCCFKWTRFYTQVTCQQAYDYRSGQSPPDGTKRQCPDNDKLITASLIIQALILALQSIDCTKPVDWDKIETSLGTIALSLQQFENSMYYFLRDNGYLNMQQPWEQSCNTAWDTKHVCQPGWYCLDFVAGGCGCAYFDDYPPGDATYVVASGPWGDEASCQVACACGGGYYGG